MRTGGSKRSGWTAIALAAAALAAAGCTPLATYPPIETTSVETRPLFTPMPYLMAEALWYCNTEYGSGDTQFAYNLPEGTTYAVYNKVADKLRAGRPMQVPGEPAYHVQQVRLRGADAEVDVVVPQAGGRYELVTVTFRGDLIEGWQVTRARVWRIPQPPPPPTYVPPPPESEVQVAGETGNPAPEPID
jgi:hypothetical protein